VAAIGLVAVAFVLGTRGGQNTTTPAGEPAAVVAGAEEVATGFVEAFGAFDADRAIAYLADDADLSGLEGGTQKLPSLLSLLEAQGYKQMLTSCDGSGSTASGTDVVCTFDFHGIRSDEIGLGPYSGSSFDLTVRDGEIVRASVYWETGEFSPQMWARSRPSVWTPLSRGPPLDGPLQGGDTRAVGAAALRAVTAISTGCSVRSNSSIETR